MYRIPGLGLARGVQVMTRLYEASAYIDNRASGMFWGLAQARQRFGLLIDASAHVEILPDGTLRSSGETPVMLVDARGASTTAFPTWRDPGKSQPRQNAALVGGRLHVLSAGQTFSLVEPAAVAREAHEFRGEAPLVQAYPNPFNSRTNITMLLPARDRWTLTVLDLLGREVVTLIDYAESGPGRVSRTWDATGAAAGMYYVRLRSRHSVVTTPLLLLR